MNVCKVASRIRLQKQEDRLEDFSFLKKSSSLYCSYNVWVMAKLEYMEDFFM